MHLYFWDRRDGDELAGWWVSPVIGGEEVFAHHPDVDAAAPPRSGWRCPWNETKPNGSIAIMLCSKDEADKALWK